MSKESLMNQIQQLAALRDDYDLKEADIEVLERALREEEEPLSQEELCACLASIVLSYKHVRAYWRGKAYLPHLLRLLDEKQDLFAQDDLLALYIALGGYCKMVSNLHLALHCYEKAYTLSPTEDVLYQIVVAQKCLHPDFTLPDSPEELLQKYPRQGQRIMRALEGKGFLKVDPVEHTEAFQAVYDKVHEKMLARLEEEGDLHFVLQQWTILASLYLEEGIVWRSPAAMNPSVRFD